MFIPIAMIAQKQRQFVSGGFGVRDRRGLKGIEL
jgi:hypothetical protein